MSSTHNKKENDNKISRYLLKELLVEQAVGAIYLAQDEASGEAVFLVTLQPDAAKSSDLSDRFLRRAETIAQLKHEAILPLLDHGLDGKRPFAVMPHQPGQFLAKQLETSPPIEPQDQTAVFQSLTLVKQIASGLSVAHPTGLIHHNLRPENIYLDASGNPYLVDLVVPPAPPITSQIEQEPPAELDYQSPEQLAGKTLSGRSNIFSLGILLYRLLAGHRPPLPASEWDIFEHKGVAREVSLNQVRPGLTSATYLAVQDSIWQKEWSRFETVDAQIRAFDRALKQESAPPPTAPIWLKALTQLRQPKALKIFVPAMILLFLLILALLFRQSRSNQNLPEIEVPVPGTAVLSVEENPVIATTPEGEAPPPVNSLNITPTDGSESKLAVEETPTATATETATASPAPSLAPTETAVPTALPTQTITPSPTAQASNTPTSEPTQSSCVPSPPFGWVRYSIQPNDSLSALGQATNTTVAQLQQVNCLDTSLLSIGQLIWLPFLPNPTATATNAEPTAVLPTTTATATPPNNNTISPTPAPSLTPPTIP